MKNSELEWKYSLVLLTRSEAKKKEGKIFFFDMKDGGKLFMIYGDLRIFFIQYFKASWFRFSSLGIFSQSYRGDRVEISTFDPRV